jgi:hypothetical protein
MMQVEKQVVIAGGGTAGWMAANLLATKWQNLPIKITLVESPDIGIIGVGEGSTPSLKRFFETLNIAEHEWMPKCNATYKLSITFADWSPQSGIEAYSHPFTSKVDTFTYKAFNMNCRTRRLGLDTNVTPGDFFINSILSQLGKKPHIPSHFPFPIEYGYHFDSYLMGEFLAQHASSLGIKRIQQKIDSVNTTTTGDINAIVLDNKEIITGDLFVDCTGFAALLTEKTLHTPFESFSDNLFNDAAVVFPTEPISPLPLETKATALSSGWAWRIPLVNRTGNGYVYSSKYLSKQAAEEELRAHLSLGPKPKARHLNMRVGQRSLHWHKNCLALGLSQGFIEPLEATALHLVQLTCEKFAQHVMQNIDSLPLEQGWTNKGQRAFNEDIHNRFERVRDYIVAHYKLNTRSDSQYWIDNRENENLSTPLVDVLSGWYQNKDMVALVNQLQLGDHFNANSWNAILAGYGTFPALAANQPSQGDLYKEQNIGTFLSQCAVNFPNN